MNATSEIGGFLGRFIASCIITALISVGGVWLVVDLSLRGIEKAVETTNARIDDVNRRLDRMEARGDRIEDQLAAMQGQIMQGFGELKRASLDVTPSDNILDSVTVKGGKVEPLADVQRATHFERVLEQTIGSPKSATSTDVEGGERPLISNGSE